MQSVFVNDKKNNIIEVSLREGTCKDVIIDLGICTLPSEKFYIFYNGKDVSHKPLADFEGQTIEIMLISSKPSPPVSSEKKKARRMKTARMPSATPAPSSFSFKRIWIFLTDDDIIEIFKILIWIGYVLFISFIWWKLGKFLFDFIKDFF